MDPRVEDCRPFAQATYGGLNCYYGQSLYSQVRHAQSIAHTQPSTNGTTSWGLRQHLIDMHQEAQSAKDVKATKQNDDSEAGEAGYAPGLWTEEEKQLFKPIMDETMARLASQKSESHKTRPETLVIPPKPHPEEHYRKWPSRKKEVELRCGTLPWTAISREFTAQWRRLHPGPGPSGRSAKQCREKFNEDNLWPEFKKTQISSKDTAEIMRLAEKFSKNWAEISEILDLPENRMKNKWYQEDKKRRTRQANAAASQSQMILPITGTHSGRISKSTRSARQPLSTPTQQNAALQQAVERHVARHATAPAEPEHHRRYSVVSDGYPPSLVTDSGSSIDSPRSASYASPIHETVALPSCALPTQTPGHHKPHYQGEDRRVIDLLNGRARSSGFFDVVMRPST